MKDLLNFIDGRFVPARSRQWLDVEEPAVGRPHARVAASDAEDVADAVGAAKGAFAGWSGTPVAERSRVLVRLAELIERDVERLAAAESMDTGKPVSLARTMDIPRAAENLRFFAGAVLYSGAEVYDMGVGGGARGQSAAGGGMNYVLRSPRGVAGLISPWNLPLYLLTWKIGPALATGNTAVCKPSEVTPLTATLLCELANEAGLPPGVLNVVHGPGAAAGGALVQHPDVPTISFTGSTGVGRWIGREAGERLKRVSLELGGKNPLVIFADADLDKAIDTAARAAFTNQGQICLCGSRVLVERSVYERVREGLVARARALVPGDPADAATKFGSLVGRAHLEKVAGMVEEARELGGKVVCGGSRPAPASLPQRVMGGAFYLPTVIEGLDPACRIEQEEIFGPVVTLQPFETEEDALRLANGTKYGLAATVFTGSADRANRFAAKLEAGIVWVNCWLVRDLRTPFGGMKQSGVGREGGNEAIRFFTEAKNVCVGF